MDDRGKSRTKHAERYSMAIEIIVAYLSETAV